MKTLNNSPVVEALAQINFDATSKISFEVIETISKSFKVTSIEDINELILLPDGVSQINKFGKKLINRDSATVIQITRDFFAFSLTSKYKDWEHFSGLATAQFETFLSGLKIGNVNRVAVRYTNKIPVKGGLKNIKTVLQTRPELQNFLGYSPETVSMQMVMPLDKIDGRSIVTMRIDKTAKDDSILLLDLDVFMLGNFKPEIKTLISEFEKLRDSKNEIFEKVLTNECIESFD